MIRMTLAVLLGLLTSLAIISLLMFLGMSMLAPPNTPVPGTEADLARLVEMESMPQRLLKLVSWILAAFSGAWIAARLAGNDRRRRAAIAVGLLLVAGLGFTTLTLPYPAWMTVAGMLLPLPIAWFAASLATPSPTTPRSA